MIPDKVALLMGETGCEKSEAELALEMCGFDVEQAIKAVPRLLKNIVALKGKLRLPEENRFGVLLVILNIKTHALLRSRAVLSYNPAVYAVPLDKDWFEFEKHLYACRLWEGSLQAESLEIEQAVASRFRAGGAVEAFEPGEEASKAAEADLAGLLRGVLRAPALEFRLKSDLLDLGQFQSLRSDAAAPSGRAPARSQQREEELLILKAALEEDPGGVPVAELRAGDLVPVFITDARDIAQYLARVFGGHSEKGPLAISAPVEAIEAQPTGLLVRVRFSVGVCGDATLKADARVRTSRPIGRDNSSWWKRLFKS